MMANFSLDAAVPRPHPAVTSIAAGDRVVAHQAINDEVVLLDPVSTLVWAALDGRGTVRDLAIDLAQALAAPLRTVEADLLTLLDDLQRLGLLNGSPLSASQERGDRSRLTDPPAP